MKIRLVGDESFHADREKDGRTDGRTDGPKKNLKDTHDEVNSCFSQFWERAYNLIKVAALLKTSVCGRLLAGIAGFESRLGHGSLFLVSVVCRHEWATESGWSLVQRSISKCDVSGRELEASTMRNVWPVEALVLLKLLASRGCSAVKTFDQ